MLTRKLLRGLAALSIGCLLIALFRCIIYRFTNPQISKSQPKIILSADNSNSRYGPFLSRAPIGKDLVVHSAIFDDRARNGYSNATMIFLSVDNPILHSNRILGCGVGDKMADNYYIHSVAESLKMHAWLGETFFKYENTVMECYNLPARDGERVFVIYQPSENSSLKFVVESEQSLFIPAPRVMPKGKHNFTVVTCTKVHNKKAAYFAEYINYQKTIGVDHVHVSIPDTFIMDGGLQHHLIKEPSLRLALREGYVTISTFKNWYNDSNQEIFVHSESLRKLECIYHFRGTYDYAFPLDIDTDNFFNPRVPGKTQLKDYIKDYCYEKPAASCIFKWYFYFPQLCGMKGEVGEDGNVTRQLKSYRMNVKSVHNTNILVDCTFHHAECKGCLLPGYKAVRVSPHDAYKAHNRLDYGGVSKEDACLIAIDY